jgi:putative membrane protein
MQLSETDSRGGTSALPAKSKSVDDPRVYLAAERTFLAWVRTSISLMGFGFVIARFALWTREFGLSGRATSSVPAGISTLLGFGMVCVGVFVCMAATLRHRDYVRDLESGVSNPPLPIKTALAVATILTLVGLALAINILTL